MDNITVSRLMRLINGLSIESKLEILSKLSEDLKVNFNSGKNTKENLLDELFGLWNGTGESLSDEVLKSRNSSDKDISFD